MNKKKRQLSDQIPPFGRKLTKFTGKELIDRVGQDIINNVVTSILSGENVRNLTEDTAQVVDITILKEITAFPHSGQLSRLLFKSPTHSTCATW